MNRPFLMASALESIACADAYPGDVTSARAALVDALAVHDLLGDDRGGWDRAGWEVFGKATVNLALVSKGDAHHAYQLSAPQALALAKVLVELEECDHEEVCDAIDLVDDGEKAAA